MPQSGRWNDEELAAFEAGLTPENLTAIMRSTWTWDDRALRRDLARLLTALRAVGELEPGGDVHRLVRRRALHSAAGFLAAVLGPRVIADSGHATSYSFSDTLVRSPWLAGGPDEERLLAAVGAATLEDGSGAAGFDLAASSSFAARGLAAHALAAAGDQEAGAELLSKIEAGALSATLAAAEASGSWDPALVRTRASLDGSQWFLDGREVLRPARRHRQRPARRRSQHGWSLAVRRRSGSRRTDRHRDADHRSHAPAGAGPARRRARRAGRHRGCGRQADGADPGPGDDVAGRGAGPRDPPLSRAGCRCPERDGPAGRRRRSDGTPSSGSRPRSPASCGSTPAGCADDAAEGGVAAAMAHIACSETFTAVAGATLQLVGRSRGRRGRRGRRAPPPGTVVRPPVRRTGALLRAAPRADGHLTPAVSAGMTRWSVPRVSTSP